jgi:two-component system LytT family response regulator
MKRDGRKIRVLIADDQNLVRDCVRSAVAGDADVQVIAECTSVADTVSAIQAYRPDIVMLAMALPEGGAFDVIEQIRPSRMPHVIFLTRSDDDSARGLDAYNLEHLVAPFSDDAVRASVEQFRHSRAQAGTADGVAERLTDFLANRATRPIDGSSSSRTLTRFMIRERERIRFIAAEDVDWIEGARNYVRLHVGDKSHLLRGPLTAIHAQLDPAMFARIHRSIIVNVDRIGEVQPWVGGDYIAILRSGERLRVSRNFRESVVRPAARASA